MTGENEHERDSADDPTPPDDSMPEFELNSSDESTAPAPDDQVERKSRRFRAWGAAQKEESGPSFWRRASERVRGIFTKPKSDVVEEDVAEVPFEVEKDAEPLPEFESADELSIPIVEPPAEVPALSDPAFYIPPDEPKEDLKFLRTGENDAIPMSDFEAEGPTADTDAPAEPPVELPPEPPRKKRASLLKRVFFTPIVFGARAKKAETPLEVEEGAAAADDEEVPDTDETEIPAPVAFDEPAVVDEAHPAEAASLDEALPMDEPITDPITDPMGLDAVAPEVEPEAPKKAGFFARLFGRKPAESAPPPDEAFDVEPEVAADSVGQLDAADEGFEVARSEFAPPSRDAAPFATVDDALPLDEPAPALSELSDGNVMEAPPFVESTMDAQPAVTASSFAPPPPAPPVAAASDEHSFFGGNTFDFDTPKADDRSTMEVAKVDDRKTAEVSPELLAHADEVERKTDEFEMIELDGATLQEPAVSPMEGKTAEVPKVSIFKKLFSRTKEVTQVEPAVAPPPSANPTFLVQKFRTFYNEVVVYKNQKAELTAGFATAIVTSYDADLSPEQAANSLSQRLQQMLELQLAESSWMGGEIQELYPNAQYAMACLADEMLSNMEWPGQAAWGKHRLELTVFKTAASDLELFKRVDKLLKNGPQTVGTRDLARVYLLAIASGFKGKYRPFDLPRALAEYRRRLYEFVYDGDALLLYAEERRIFPEAVSVTVAGKGVKRISMAQQWAAILVLLLVGYTVISHLAWKKVSADLKDIAGRVEQARTASPSDTPNGGGGR